jgi:hypothetical protein
MTAGIMVTGVAGTGITGVMCRAATIAAGIPDIMTAITTADLVGVTAATAIMVGIAAGVDVTTDGTAVIAAGMTDGAVVAADVTTVGAAAAVADMTAIADVGDIAAVTRRERADEEGPASQPAFLVLSRFQITA